jgi:hypothetical protein
MRTVLYELPEVIAVARESLGQYKQCSLISGDFFKSIPPDGNAYLLKSVLHDWADKDVVRILEKCHEAIAEDSKLIIVEPIVNSANQKDPAKLMDVYMMVITGGKERTAQDFETLLDQSGFVIDSIIPTETEFYIIEARKK